MPEASQDNSLLDQPNTEVSTPVPPIAPSTVSPPSSRTPVDERLDQLENLATELHQLEEQPSGSSAPNLWPPEFRLSIIVPVYNEVTTIEPMLHKLLALDIPKQIIVVDDGSQDGTQELLTGWLDRDDVDIVLKGRNEGKGAALRTGFAAVDGDLVVIQDADLEYDPTDILDLVRPILEGEADVVYGSRFLEQRWQGSSVVHRFGNWLLTALSNFTTGLTLTDMETCYKVFPAVLLNEVEVRQNRFGFEPELTAKLARRQLEFLELPIHYRARDWDEGKKIGIRDGINAVYCIMRYAWFD